MAREKAFTLIELMVVIGIIAVLAGLLLGSVARAKEKTRTIQCVSNLKQWGTALFFYTADNEDYTPRRGQGVQPVMVINRAEDWFNALPPLLGLPTYETLAAGGRIPEAHETTVFSCPRAQRGTHSNFLSYAMNMYLSPWIRPEPHRYGEIPRPSSLAFMADGPCAYASTVPSANGYSVQARHTGRANIALLDGHVESFEGKRIGCGVGQPSPELGDLRWQTETSGINQLPVP
jgi:prepilin-type N-terminal cleavage/methylation domain-containing protein/prepilin-type processing-associated H-X9-DG protein